MAMSVGRGDRQKKVRRLASVAAVSTALLGGTLLGPGVASAQPLDFSAQPLSYVYYDVVARHSGKCLDVRGASDADQALAQQYTCHGGTNQQWRLVPRGGGYYNLISANSGKCLDVRGASTADQAVAQQYTCHGGFNQQWRQVPRGAGYYNLVARHSGKCLDVRGASTANQALAQQYTCHAGFNQQWRLR